MLKNFLFKTTPDSSFINEISMLIFRVSAGLMMAFLHGRGKIPPSEKFISGVEALNFPLPTIFAWSAGISEFVGGLLLALGLFTRPSALLIACTMIVAAFGRHINDPWSVKELSLIYLVISLVFLTRGSGKFSIDNLIKQ